jgi:hypothetical protein
MTVYGLWSLLVVRTAFAGTQARLVLLLTPVVVLAIMRAPKLAMLATIPAATFGTVVLPSLLSYRAYVLVIAVAGLGLIGRKWRLWLPFHLPLVLLGVVTLFSAATIETADIPYSVRLFAILTVIGLMTCGAAALIRPSLVAVAGAVTVTGVLVAVSVLAGWFAIADRKPVNVVIPDDLRRAYALGLNPNYLGIIIVLGAVASVGLAVELRRPWLVAAAVPCAMALSEVRSRGAFALVLIGVTWVLLASPIRRGRRVVLSAIIVGGVLLFAPSAPADLYRSVVGGRADLDLSGSDQARVSAATYAIEQGLAHPLLGLGYGRFQVTAGAHFSLGQLGNHNEYLRHFSELGFVGLALFLVVIVQVGRAVRACEMPITAGAVLMTYAGAMLTADTLMSLPTSMGVLVLSGAVVGNSRLSVGTSPPDPVGGVEHTRRHRVMRGGIGVSLRVAKSD